MVELCHLKHSFSVSQICGLLVAFECFFQVLFSVDAELVPPTKNAEFLTVHISKYDEKSTNMRQSQEQSLSPLPPITDDTSSTTHSSASNRHYEFTGTFK
ncbi:14769_t:CDS:2, partial [Dentiscutata erythropus]